MAGTYTATDSYSSGPTRADQSNINCYGADQPSSATPSSYPITIPGAGNAYSYEKYYQARWTGSWTSIDNVLFYVSAWSPGTGQTLYGKDVGSQTYTQSVAPTDTTGLTIYTSWDTVGEAIDITPASAITPTTQEYSDYFVIVLEVASTASQGAVPTWTFTTQWDET